ncbi:DUF805 domain-containing protein [Yoonia sp.]|uniref:DUF805 domain-containing protein n=1 Tax=Yoonia sp. TaxID=2212373 RepID=UPI0025F93D62|nr:DUF805 domain-containing protein [Yoonia sp.]
MTFTESINTCLRQKYVTFSGRAQRSEYWWFFLATFLFYIAFAMLAGLVFAVVGVSDPNASNGMSAGMIIMVILGLILFVALFLPGISVGVRRLHDRNMSGWWYLGAMIAGQIPLVGAVVGIAFLVLMALKGTDGPNRFGPDPLKGGDAEIFA